MLSVFILLFPSFEILAIKETLFIDICCDKKRESLLVFATK